MLSYAADVLEAKGGYLAATKFMVGFGGCNAASRNNLSIIYWYLMHCIVFRVRL